jgi:hypothetical protein
MIDLVAFNGKDLLQSIDYRTETKAHSCNGVLYGFDKNSWTVRFVTTCSKSRNSWEQRVQFVDAETIIAPEKTFQVTSLETLLEYYPDIIETDIRVGCNCPAYKYFYSYIITQLESEMDPEERYPHIKNPNLEGSFCKHLATVIRKYLI